MARQAFQGLTTHHHFITIPSLYYYNTTTTIFILQYGNNTTTITTTLPTIENKYKQEKEKNAAGVELQQGARDGEADEGEGAEVEGQLQGRWQSQDNKKYKIEHGASLVTAVSIATKRLGTNDKPAKEEGGPQRGDQGPAARIKATSTDQTPSS